LDWFLKSIREMLQGGGGGGCEARRTRDFLDDRSLEGIGLCRLLMTAFVLYSDWNYSPN
jgi:hypothetical protein